MVCRLEESKIEDYGGLVKLPNAFGKEASRKTSKSVLKNYLRTKKGIIGTLLKYIMNINYGPGQGGEEYSTEHVHLVLITTWEGKAYEADNGKVWLALMDLMLRR